MKARASIGVSWGSYHIGCISAEAWELLCPPPGFLVSRKHPTWVMRGQTQTVTQGSTSIQQTGGASVPADAVVSPAPGLALPSLISRRSLPPAKGSPAWCGAFLPRVH